MSLLTSSQEWCCFKQYQSYSKNKNKNNLPVKCAKMEAELSMTVTLWPLHLHTHRLLFCSSKSKPEAKVIEFCLCPQQIYQSRWRCANSITPSTQPSIFIANRLVSKTETDLGRKESSKLNKPYSGQYQWKHMASRDKAAFYNHIVTIRIRSFSFIKKLKLREVKVLLVTTTLRVPPWGTILTLWLLMGTEIPWLPRSLRVTTSSAVDGLALRA